MFFTDSFTRTTGQVFLWNISRMDCHNVCTYILKSQMEHCKQSRQQEENSLKQQRATMNTVDNWNAGQ